MDPLGQIFTNPGNAQTIEHGEAVNLSSVAQYRGIVQPKHPGGEYFEITPTGLYVSVMLRDVGATLVVKWAEAYARNQYGEITPPELGTEVDLAFDNGILVAHLGKTGMGEYSVSNPPPKHPRMLREWQQARLTMDGPHGNVRMVDKNQNVDEIVLGNTSRHLVGAEAISRQGPDVSQAEASAFAAADADMDALRYLDAIVEEA